MIEKNGTLKQQNSRALDRDSLYKKCGFRKKDGFENVHTWKSDITQSHTIELWGKTTGNNIFENTYTFPMVNVPTLYYGTMALIAVDVDGNITNLTTEIWQTIYDMLCLKNTPAPENDLDKLEYESEDDTNTVSSGSELEEEDYYFSDS